MDYNNMPVMPDKYLLPNGSITTFAGVEWAPADEDREILYSRIDTQAAKWLMPDGSIVAAIPISTTAMDLLYVPLTRTVNGKALSANIVLTSDDIGISNPLVYKGSIDCSTNPNYPAADCGHTYFVSVAGKIGGASGTAVAAGDMIVCNADATPAGDQATVGAYWNIFEKNVDFGNIIVTGGTINGAVIGGTDPKAITATTLTTTGDIELGNASDTTLHRDSAGVASVEGKAIYLAGGTDVAVTDGGTGLSTITDHGIMLGSGTGAVTALGVATNGQLPIGSTGADPVLATLTEGDGIDITNAAGAITIGVDLKANGGLVIEAAELAVDLGASTITGTLAVGDGGTGATTLTDHGVLLGSGTGAITPLGVATNGQLVIGSTGTDPVLATLTEGEAIDVTNVAGAITIACEDATTANKGVTVYSGSTKALAGTDTASAMTPADVAAAQAVVSNPKAMSQGVYLTASATVGGIANATSTVYKNTTNSFIFGIHAALPSWTTATVLRSCLATNEGYQLEVVATTGAFKVTLDTTTYTSSIPGGGAASNLVAGTDHKVIAVVTVGASTTTVSFYLDNALLNTTDAQANVDVTNTNIYYTGGLVTTRYAMTVYDVYDYNRALTAAEVLDLYRNGIAFADKWGSQTAYYTSGFSGGVDGWITTGGALLGGQDPLGGADLTWVKFTIDGSTGLHNMVKYTGVSLYGKYQRIVYEIFVPSTNSQIFRTLLANESPANYDTPSVDTPTTFKHEYKEVSTNNYYLYFQTGSSYTGNGTDVVYIREWKGYQAGATLALESPGIQPAPGQWLDSSSNKLHAMQPATGSSLARTKKDFEYRWTNTWTASSAAQYVGGLNQAALSADHFITDIITQATETTDVENLELGDGSAVAKFVAAFTPSATRTKQTVAAQNDGTNLKLVYTPAAEATMTVETIIRGFIWEP